MAGGWVWLVENIGSGEVVYPRRRREVGGSRPGMSVGVGSFLLTAKSFFTYGWSLLLTVSWLGLFNLRLKFGLVFLAYGAKSVWSFFAYGSPRSGN